jgi:hypothetical protein
MNGDQKSHVTQLLYDARLPDDGEFSNVAHVQVHVQGARTPIPRVNTRLDVTRRQNPLVRPLIAASIARSSVRQRSFLAQPGRLERGLILILILDTVALGD